MKSTRRTLTAILGVICGIVFLSSPSSGQTALVVGGGEPLNLHVDFVEEAGALGTLQWTKTVTKPGSSFVRLHITNLVNSPEQPFELRASDKQGHVLIRVGDSSRSSFWTPAVTGDTIKMEVYAPLRPEKLKFDIDYMVFQRSEGVKYSIPGGQDEREEIFEMPAAVQLRARSVGKLEFVSDGVPKSCTGFLIGPASFMTNNHCVSNQEECDSTVVTFGYQYDANGTLGLGEKVNCSKVVITSAPLDFTVLELGERAGDVWGVLTLSDKDPSIGDQGLLIEHGGGMPKQISRRKCKVTVEPADAKEKDSDFAHVCDTVEGASGSPVLGADLTVIGLHHLGFDPPGPWSEQNRAVRATKIRAQLVAIGIVK
jgi:V8-like Glu-specific endopeptidase